MSNTHGHMAVYRWTCLPCPAQAGAIRYPPALRRLCGWETLGQVPSEATFSRAFDAFARDGRPQ